MELFSYIASLLTIMLSVYVGIRLLAVARRTRGAAEVAMGAYQSLIVLAIVIYAFVRVLHARGQLENLFTLVVAANLLIAFGVVALAVGVWRIYRPSDRWAAILCGVLSLWVMAGWLATSLGDALPTTSVATPSNAFYVTGRSAVYLWGGAEALRYHRMMLRRVALGLGDVVVAHQILLWGCFSLAMGSLAVTTLTAGFIMGEAYATWTPGTFLTPIVSLISSICLWLGFFPPASYRRFIEARPLATPA